MRSLTGDLRVDERDRDLRVSGDFSQTIPDSKCHFVIVILNVNVIIHSSALLLGTTAGKCRILYLKSIQSGRSRSTYKILK